MCFCFLSPAQSIVLVTLSSGDSMQKPRHRETAQVIPPYPTLHRCSQSPCYQRLPKVLFQVLTVRYSVSFGLASRVCMCSSKDLITDSGQKNLLSVSRKSWKQSGFQGNVRSKAEGVVARAAGLVRAEMHTALLDSRGATPTHSPNHHSLLMMWSNKTLKNCISSIQMHHFSVSQL